MKTYNQTIEMIADKQYHNYMGGSMSYYENVDDVAFIFEKDKSEVTKDVDNIFYKRIGKSAK